MSETDGNRATRAVDRSRRSAAEPRSPCTGSAPAKQRAGAAIRRPIAAEARGRFLVACPKFP